MIAVAIEVSLPAECRNVTGALEYRDKLAQAATEFGWLAAHTADTAVITVAANQPKQPIAVGLHWEVEGDNHLAIHDALAAIRDQYDISYMTVDGVLIAADHPEICATELDFAKAHRP